MTRGALVIGLALAACQGGGSDPRKERPEPKPTPTPVPTPTPAPGPTPVGRCDNLEGVAASCTTMPMRIGAEDGLVRYDVSVAVDAGAKGQHVVVLHLRVPEANAAELEQHYRSAVAKPCTAIIIRPPCNPASSDVVIPALPVPTYATREIY